jgi:colicin import membrane protein
VTSTEQYTAVAGQLKTATEKSAELWKQGAQALTQQGELLSKLPRLDPTAGVERYFDLLQKAVDVNRDLATKWAEAVSSMTGALSNQVGTVTDIARGQATAVADLVTEQAAKAEQIAQEQAEQAEEEAKAEARRERAAERAAAKEAEEKAEQAEEEAKAEARRVRAAERAAAKEAEEKAREAYVGLSKAELSDKLVERDLPKSGTVEELINRLVEADTSK